MLIAFEGIEGCGKGTQITLLQSELNFKHERFPRKTNGFGILKEWLYGKIEFNEKVTFFLFLADILDATSHFKENEIWVVDRYLASTAAYEKKGISFNEAKKIIELSHPLKPDLIIWLDISVDESIKRKTYQKSKNNDKLEIYEGKREYLEKVRRNYEKLYNERFLTDNWVKINGERDIELVFNDVLREVKKAVESIQQ